MNDFILFFYICIYHLIMPAIQNIDPAYYRYEALFNHASMGIVVVNSEGAIQSANPFALKLFGYAIEEILEKPIEILIPGRYHHKHIDYRRTYIQAKEQADGCWVGFVCEEKGWNRISC